MTPRLWAHQRRASAWPLLRLILLAFLAGIVAGLLVALFAVSALSSSHIAPETGRATGEHGRDGGSAVRAGVNVAGPRGTVTPVSPQTDEADVALAPRSVADGSPTDVARAHQQPRGGDAHAVSHGAIVTGG